MIDPIANGEAGLSVRTKINQSFLDIETKLESVNDLVPVEVGNTNIVKPTGPWFAEGNTGSVALGYGNKSYGSDGYAGAYIAQNSTIGVNNLAEHANGYGRITAVGYGNVVTQSYGIAVGYNCETSGLRSASFGHEAKCSGGSSISVGLNTNVPGHYSTVLGVTKYGGIQATNDYSVCIASAYYGSNTTASSTIAIGAGRYGAQCDSGSYGSVVIGANAYAAQSPLSTALGQGAHTYYSNSSISLGQSTQLHYSDHSIALGSSASCTYTSTNSIAIGKSALCTYANGPKSLIAIGNGAAVSSCGAGVAIGYNASCTGSYSTAIGAGVANITSASFEFGTDNVNKVALKGTGDLVHPTANGSSGLANGQFVFFTDGTNLKVKWKTTGGTETTSIIA